MSELSIVNGSTPPKLHELVIAFDPASQQIGLKFHTGEFKDWNYIIGILEAAKVHAQDKKREAQMLAMQQAAQQQAEAQAVRRAIHRG